MAAIIFSIAGASQTQAQFEIKSGISNLMIRTYDPVGDQRRAYFNEPNKGDADQGARMYLSNKAEQMWSVELTAKPDLRDLEKYNYIPVRDGDMVTLSPIDRSVREQSTLYLTMGPAEGTDEITLATQPLGKGNGRRDHVFIIHKLTKSGNGDEIIRQSDAVAFTSRAYPKLSIGIDFRMPDNRVEQCLLFATKKPFKWELVPR